MARTAIWVKRTALVTSLAAFIGLAACDRQGERMERISELGDAVLGQLGGEDVTVPSGPDYADVSQDARSFAGSLQEPVVPTASDAAAARFVIGSIVAKPAALPAQVEVAEVIAEPERSFDVVVDEQSEAKIIVPDAQTVDRFVLDPDAIRKLEAPTARKRAITVIDPDARSRTPAVTGTVMNEEPIVSRAPLKETVDQKRYDRGITQEPVIRTRSLALQLPATPEERMAQLPKLNPKVAERALILPNAALERQLIAEDRMIEAATKFKVAASIQRSRSGQMVIEIGADALNPTNFTGAVMQSGRIAMDTEVKCDSAAAQRGEANAIVAMQCVIDDLQASGEFEYVEKDWLYEHEMIRRPGQPVAPAKLTPNDPLFGLQWHFKSQGTERDESPGGAGFVDFWTDQDSQGSSEVVVAVIDTGLQMNHPDIRSSINVVDGWDMVSEIDVANDGDGRDNDPDDPGDVCPQANVLENTYHGTHVAGIVGAASTNNEDGVAGGAWNVKVVPVRALGKCGGKLSDINDAIRWAAGTIPEFDELGQEVWNDNPADIINLSLGLFRTCPRSMQDAINDVTAHGVVVVVAAGNRSVPTEFYAPAGCENVVTVAGGDARGFLAPYSNYGSDVDVLAPGGDMSRDDNGDGNPDGVLSTKTAENCSDPLTGDTVSTCYYAYEQGTSMATPHVSAALALIKSKRPDLSASELVTTLMSGISSIPEERCTAECVLYPGAVPLDEDENICLRPCGSGLLNLADIDLPN